MTHAAMSWARRTPNLSPSARLVLEEMANCSNAKNATVWPSQALLARLLHRTDRQIRRLQLELETKGKIRSVGSPGAGRGRRSKHYILAYDDVAEAERVVTDAMVAAAKAALSAGDGKPSVDIFVREQGASQPDAQVLTAGNPCASQPEKSVHSGAAYIEEPLPEPLNEPREAFASLTPPSGGDDIVDADFEEIAGKGAVEEPPEAEAEPVEAKPTDGDLFPAQGRALALPHGKKPRYANGSLHAACVEAVAIWNAAAKANPGWVACKIWEGAGKVASKRRAVLEARLQEFGLEGWQTVVSVLERDQWWTDPAFRARKGRSSWKPCIDSMMRAEAFAKRLEGADVADADAFGPSTTRRPPKGTSEQVIAAAGPDGMVSDADVAAYLNNIRQYSRARTGPAADLRAAQNDAALEALREFQAKKAAG